MILTLVPFLKWNGGIGTVGEMPKYWKWAKGWEA